MEVPDPDRDLKLKHSRIIWELARSLGGILTGYSTSPNEGITFQEVQGRGIYLRLSGEDTCFTLRISMANNTLEDLDFVKKAAAISHEIHPMPYLMEAIEILRWHPSLEIQGHNNPASQVLILTSPAFGLSEAYSFSFKNGKATGHSGFEPMASSSLGAYRACCSLYRKYGGSI